MKNQEHNTMCIMSALHYILINIHRYIGKWKMRIMAKIENENETGNEKRKMMENMTERRDGKKRGKRRNKNVERIKANNKT